MAHTTLAKTKPKALAIRKAPAKLNPGKSAKKVSAGDRQAMIRDAAYFKAMQSGFNGDCLEHWLAAEKEIDRKLNRA
jgi:hypothetical protein